MAVVAIRTMFATILLMLAVVIPLPSISIYLSGSMLGCCWQVGLMVLARCFITAPGPIDALGLVTCSILSVTLLASGFLDRQVPNGLPYQNNPGNSCSLPLLVAEEKLIPLAFWRC
jgi:hypothetical protein